MRRNLFHALACLHLGSVLLFNIASLLQNHRQPRHGGGSGIVDTFAKRAGRLMALPAVNIFVHCTGIATGYGFFAPQVGSSFTLEVSALDATGSVVSQLTDPPLAHPHSVLRYNTLLGRLQHLIPDSPDTDPSTALVVRQARAITHCISQRVARLRWGDRFGQLRCNVYMYRHPQLRAFGTASTANLLLIYERDIPYRNTP